MVIDVEHERSLTRALTRDSPPAHLNNAGAALPTAATADSVIDHLRLEEQLGGYEAERVASDATSDTYRQLAALLNTSPDTVALTDSSSRAWRSVLQAVAPGPDDRILVGRAEYVSNAMALLTLRERHGVRVELVEDDAVGQLDLEDLERRLTEPAALLCLTHVPTQGGLVNPVAAACALARASGVTTLVDATQSVGQLDVDITAIGCDALVGTSRKFLRGPRGVGFLVVREGIEPAWPDLAGASWRDAETIEVRRDARRFETWESPVAARIGLGRAVAHARGLGMTAIERRVTGLAARLRGDLAELTDVTVHDRGSRLCGIVTFAVDGREPGDIVGQLSGRGVNTGTTLADYARWDLGRHGPSALVRASVHYYNNEADLDRLVKGVAAITRA